MNPTPDFDSLARPYRWLEYISFGPYLQIARTCFLPQLADCRSALILGDGDGRFTARLLQSLPMVRVHAVDASAQMLSRLLQNSALFVDRVSTETADLRIWKPGTEVQYDLVVTHFLLDCLTTDEVAGLAMRLNAVLGTDALWLVSDFQVPKNFFGKLFAAPLVNCLYHAFGVLTGLRLRKLPDHAAALHSRGWRILREKRHLHGLLISQLWRRDLADDRSQRSASCF